MVRLGNVWDSTTQVLNGRGGMLAGIAALLIILPGIVSNIVSTMVRAGIVGETGSGTSGGAASAGAALVVAVVALLSICFTIWGQLSITAAASDPNILRRGAMALGLRRLPVALGIYLLIAIAGILLMLPIFIAVASAGVNFGQPSTVIAQNIPAGTRAFIGIYVLALILFALWVSARLFLLNPVLINEREGVRSPGRSFVLTQGLLWRIIGFTVLIGIVFLVSILAAQLVAGLVFRLMLGADNPALVVILTNIATQIVTAIYVIVIATFAAQLYVAVRSKIEQSRSSEPVD